MEIAQPVVFNDLNEDAGRLLSDWDQRLKQYASAISVPFYLEKKQAVLSIYSEQLDLFDDYSLKAMSVFATYLEQIH
jgi:hypothetical protein